MSCSTLSDSYRSSMVSSPKLLPRGIPESEPVLHHLDRNDIVKDHWKHCQTTHPHPEQQQPHPHSHSQHPPTTRSRHTHSPSRTHFEYHPNTRSRYDYHPSSVPSSPLTLSGVYTMTTPPHSAHLHPSSALFHHPAAHTSSVSSLTSSGGPPGSPQTSQFTSSFPSLTSSQQHHQHPNHQLPSYYPNSVSYRNDRYRQSTTPSYEDLPRTSGRSYLTHTMRGDRPHQLNNDWRSESWSSPSSHTTRPSHHNAPHSTLAYPLSYRTNSSTSCTRGDLPSPLGEDHLDSSPPNSGMGSPHHFSTVFHQPRSHSIPPTASLIDHQSRSHSIPLTAPLIDHQPRSHSIPPTASLIDIVCHPSDQVIDVGDPILLRCEARVLCSSTKPSYQWYKDEEPIVGEMENVFKLRTSSKEDLGYYYCVVSNNAGDSQRKSSTACVRVAQGSSPPIDACLPLILEQPDSTVIITLGESLILRLVVRAQPEPVYQWFRNGNELHSSNMSEFVINCCTISDEGTYICSIKNEYGSILSNSFKVYITRRKETLEKRNSASSLTSEQVISTPPPSSPLSWRSLSPTKQARPKASSGASISEEVVRFVTTQVCRQIGPGENIEGVRKGLNISVEETEAIKLHYTSLSDRVHEMIMSWCRSSPYHTPAVLEDSLQVYGFRITIPVVTHVNTLGGLDPPPSQSPPFIAVHPSSVEVNEGDVIEMSVEAKGYSLAYQWFKDDIPYPGLTQPKVLLTDVQESSTGVYHCCVKNQYGTCNSKSAQVKVVPLKLKLPPSLQGTKPYYRSSTSSHEGVPVFSPPPNRRTNTVEPFSPERKAYREKPFASTVSENFCVENSSHRPVITEHPLSQELVFGTELHLKVVSSEGGGKLRYLWYFNGLALPIERQNEFIINTFTDEDVGDYSCEVTNDYGSIMSKKAHISLKPDDEDECSKTSLSVC